MYCGMSRFYRMPSGIMIVLMRHVNSLFICVLPDQPNGQIRRQYMYKKSAANAQIKNNTKSEKGNGKNYLKLFFTESFTYSDRKTEEEYT